MIYYCIGCGHMLYEDETEIGGTIHFKTGFHREFRGDVPLAICVSCLSKAVVKEQHSQASNAESS